MAAHALDLKSCASLTHLRAQRMVTEGHPSHLSQLAADLRTEGDVLRATVKDVLAELRATLDLIESIDGHAKRMGALHRQRRTAA